ncbi:unnamed protein product, partial [Ceratitis capitata]
APVCSTSTMVVIGASLEEAVPIPCRVNSDPPEIDFEWTFSTSGEHFEVPSGHYATIQEATTTGDVHRTIIEANDTHFETYVETVSELIYTPKGERDYGTLACWGQNSIGKQSEPCLFQVVPAAKPGALRNCTLRPYVVTSASLNSSNQTTMHSNQLMPAQYGRHESNFPHTEYVPAATRTPKLEQGVGVRRAGAAVLSRGAGVGADAGAAGNLATMAYINNKTDGLPTKMRMDNNNNDNNKHRVKRATDERATTATQYNNTKNKNKSKSLSKYKQKMKAHKQSLAAKELRHHQQQQSRKLNSKQTQKKMNASKRQKSNLSLPTVAGPATLLINGNHTMMSNKSNNNKQALATKYYNRRRKNTHKREVAREMSEETEKETTAASVNDASVIMSAKARRAKREIVTATPATAATSKASSGKISEDLAAVIAPATATRINKAIKINSKGTSVGGNGDFSSPPIDSINSAKNKQLQQQRPSSMANTGSAPIALAAATADEGSVEKVRIRKSLTAKNAGELPSVGDAKVNVGGKSERHYLQQHTKGSHYINSNTNFTNANNNNNNNNNNNYNKPNNKANAQSVKVNKAHNAPPSAPQISNHAVAFHHQQQQQQQHEQKTQKAQEREQQQQQQSITNTNRNIDVIGMQRAINDLASGSDESGRATEIFGNKFIYDDDDVGAEIDMTADEVDADTDTEAEADADADAEAELDAELVGGTDEADDIDVDDADLNSVIELDEELLPPTMSALQSALHLTVDTADEPHFDYSRMEYSFSNGIATHSLIGGNGNGHGVGFGGLDNVGIGGVGGGGGGTINLENYDNIIYSTMELECMPGYDGGLQQQFFLEAYDSKTKKLRLNTSSTYADIPIFRIDLSDLTSMDYYPDPNPALHLVVYSANQKGRSEPIVLENIPINEAEKRT